VTWVRLSGKYLHVMQPGQPQYNTLPSTYQNLLNLMEIWRSSDGNKNAWRYRQRLCITSRGKNEDIILFFITAKYYLIKQQHSSGFNVVIIYRQPKHVSECFCVFDISIQSLTAARVWRKWVVFFRTMQLNELAARDAQFQKILDEYNVTRNSVTELP